MPRAHGCAGAAMVRMYGSLTDSLSFATLIHPCMAYAAGAWMRRSGDGQDVRVAHGLLVLCDTYTSMYGVCRGRMDA